MARIGTTPDYDPRYERAQTLEDAKARYVSHDLAWYDELALERDIERILRDGPYPDGRPVSTDTPVFAGQRIMSDGGTDEASSDVRAFEWDPPLDTGLSGVAYLSVAMEAHYDDLGDAHAPGVYALRLSKPVDLTPATFDMRWAEYATPAPSFRDDILDADELLYVGAAANVYERIATHLEHPNRSSVVCRVFPIHDVFRVWPFPSTEGAFTHETRIALDLQHERPGAYVHCR